MNIKLLHSSITRAREFDRNLVSRITRSGTAPKLKQNECDTFSKIKLPVQNCAGSFCINEDFKNAIQGIDIYSINIAVNSIFNRVNIKKMPQLTKGINKVLKDIPEFMYIFKPRKQYKDGLDKHVLATFQQLLCHPDYQKLTPKEKNVLELATLLHDEGKAIDLGPSHPDLSAKIVASRLKSKPIEDEDRQLILKLIKHHHYSGNIAKKRMTYQEYAKIFNEDEFKLLKILTDADIKSKRTPVQYRLDENVIFFAEQEAVFKALKKPQKIKPKEVVKSAAQIALVSYGFNNVPFAI